MTFYIYPQLKLEDLTVDEFAFWSENAQWVFSQQLMVQQENAAAALTGGVK